MQTNFIDTHKFVKSYVKAKTAEKQAEVISEAFNAIQDSNFQKLATKQDIKDAKQEVKNTKQELEVKISELRSCLLYTSDAADES